ncbi:MULTISPECIES: DDE-type integrase/transposase/recombinase [Bradyrhizobium]|uniref:DDE-type integrase/transposase/recombinase n=1 Tax=Bradyrhizobium TaxID=374 RepID=UPI0003F79235|nr:MULTISPECIES: DDE-type integrase/transposase/recombinase [Bradyrhizobium]UFW48190.1 DDE-type integrase/transposase/recombinase [Bradyrhizobium arachidis]
MPTIDIKKGDLIQHFEKGLCSFDRWKAFNVMCFEKVGGGEVKLPEHKFNELHALRKIRMVEQDKDGNPIELREFGPDELWTDSGDAEQAKLTPEGRKALARQFYTRKWDEEGNGTLGDVGLQRVINKWRKRVFKLEYETNEIEEGESEPYRVKVARLRHCVKHCGRPGARPLEAFRDNRGKNSPRRLADEIETEIPKAIDHYYSARGVDYNDAYGRFREAIKQLNKKRPETEQLKYPRPEVLRRRINDALTFDNWARKTSRSEAWRKIHGHRGHIAAERPLELAIIDSTPLDVHVLDSKRLLPLGRPYLTVCLDVYSRLLLGFFITFEPPSLYSVLATLKRVNRHKGYVQKLYPQIRKPWDGWGHPTEILVDRDWSQQSPSFQHSMAELGTEVHYAPADTPQYKAICERLFDTINKGLIHKLAGAVRYNVYVMRQVGLDPAKGALITLEDLNELLHEWNEVYSYRPHDGINAVPARVWQEGLAIQRRRWIKDVAALDHVLGAVHTASISGNGIKFKNMRWHDEAVTSLLLNDLVRFEKKRSQDPRTFGQSRARVVVKFNPADASSISVWNRGGEPRPYWVRMPNVNAEALKGLTFWHLDRIREFAKERDLEFSPEDDRWDAANRLRNHWETLAGQMPMRQSRQARRGLAFELGQFDDTTVNEPIDITIDDIKDVEAEASTAGLNKVEPEGVPDQIAAELLDRDNKPNKGRTPSKVAVAKGQRTVTRKKAEQERAEHEAYVKEARGDPTGQPKARGSPVMDDDTDDEGWTEATEAPTTAPIEPPDDEFADDEGW